MPPPTSAGLTITNPLVLYRGLVATNKIKPDPAQHRLALQLQKLYFRLKDYDPEIEYRHRLDQISRSLGQNVSSAKNDRVVSDGGQKSGGILSSFWKRDGWTGPTLALTPTVSTHQSAMTIDSPQGMLLYGEVGRGKSMLLDLLADSLPSNKKRRWHFNAFMLDTFRQLEMLRKERLEFGNGLDHEHSVLTLARNMISTSPILFLDEFQLPDRTASKLLSSFLTSFFHLGGVLIATSNRMPEELAKAAGVEYMPDPRPSLSNVGDIFRYMRKQGPAEVAAATDFGIFLEVLKARCEIWEMEGELDWRRERIPSNAEADGVIENTGTMVSTEQSGISTSGMEEQLEASAPTNYHLLTASESSEFLAKSEDIWNKAVNETIRGESGTVDWQPDQIKVYGRQVSVPAQNSGVTKWDFSALCGSLMGPADYISLASSYHTLVLENVPVLTTNLRNEARRFITLLDALYEARCRLLIRAAAPPDHLFFPESKASKVDEGNDQAGESDEVYQETLAEIYQDVTNPFRPNVSLYADDVSGTPLPSPKRSILADEDADFGPVYGNGRGHGASGGDDGLIETQRRQDGPDFTRTTILTGEDERFAFKRARSRLWEMCGQRWWADRQGPADEWWKPMNRSMRHWEGVEEAAKLAQEELGEAEHFPPVGSDPSLEDVTSPEYQKDRLFRHGASPFRTRQDPPPKFEWVHIWGMMRWGKKAGDWGQGVEAKKKKDDSP